MRWDLYQNYFCPERNGTMNRWQASGKYDFVADSYGQQHPGLGFAHVQPEQSLAFFRDVWGQGVAQVREQSLFPLFIVTAKNDRFTKTGSGQT